MSDASRMREQLEGIKHAYDTDTSPLINETLNKGFGKLKSQIKDFDIKVESNQKRSQPEVTRKFTPLQIAERATKTYKEKVRPEINTPEVIPSHAPSTHASRTNIKATAKALAGMRGSGNAGQSTQNTPNGNGDLGQYTSPANNNDGDLGNNSAYGQYAALTTSMTLEQYSEYFASKFKKEETYAPLEEEEVIESYDVVRELEERLVNLDDTAWKSIDVVMRGLAKEENITPKQLHKAFRSEHGQIPDEWLKENQLRQVCGWMPLDEAERIIKNGCVYDVTCMWRGGTHRLKFFWPEEGVPSKEDMQNAVEMFYPKSILIAHYPCKDEPDNFMVVVPPVTENFDFIPADNWIELDEEVSDFIQSIYEEEGEPISAPIEVDDGILIMVEDHDTGEEMEIFIEKKGLWDNIHAKRKRGESPAKPGDKDYPKTLNVEEKGPCWTGYKRKKGTKKFADGSCVKEDAEQLDELSGKFLRDASSKANEERRKAHRDGDSTRANDKQAQSKRLFHAAQDKKRKEMNEGDEMKGLTQKGGHKRSTDSGAGLTQKGVDAVNRKTGGNLKTAVTTPPSKLKAGSKAAGRRKSFCARSRGWNGERGKAARSRWNC